MKKNIFPVILPPLFFLLISFFGLYELIFFGNVSAFKVWDDFAARAFPLLLHFLHAIRQDTTPLWNAQNFCGLPFLGEGSAALFNPLYHLSHWLSPFHVFVISVVFHHTLSGCAMYFFLRRVVHLEKPAALFGGMVYQLLPIATQSVFTIYEVHIRAPLAYFPFVLAEFSQYLENKKVKYIFYAGILIAISILMGSPLYLPLIYGGLFLYLLADKITSFITRQSTSISFSKTCAYFFGVVIISFLLAAAHFLPFLEMLSHSQRGLVTYRQPHHIIALLFNWIKSITPALRPNAHAISFFPLFLGLSCTAGICDFKNKHIKHFTFLASIVIIWLTAMEYCAPFRNMIAHIPLVKSVHELLFVFCFDISLAVIAAIGIQNILHHTTPAWHKKISLFFIGIFITWIGLFLMFYTIAGIFLTPEMLGQAINAHLVKAFYHLDLTGVRALVSPELPSSLITKTWYPLFSFLRDHIFQLDRWGYRYPAYIFGSYKWLFIGISSLQIACLVLIIRTMLKKRPAHHCIFMTCLILMASSYTWFQIGPTYNIYERWSPSCPTEKFIRSIEKPWRIAHIFDDQHDYFQNQHALFEVCPLLYNASLANGFSHMTPGNTLKILYAAEYGVDIEQALSQKDPLTTIVPNQHTRFHMHNVSSRLFDLLGIRYIFSMRPLSDTKLKFLFQSTHPTFNRLNVYENTRVIPRTFVASNIRFVPKDQLITTMIKEQNTLPETVFIEETYRADLGDIKSPSHAKSLAIGKWIVSSSNTVHIKITTDYPGIFVLTDTYYPGWKVFVNGEQADIYPVNGAFRGIKLASRGTYTITFSYHPNSLKIGLGITVVSLAGILIFFLKIVY